MLLSGSYQSKLPTLSLRIFIYRKLGFVILDICKYTYNDTRYFFRKSIQFAEIIKQLIGDCVTKTDTDISGVRLTDLNWTHMSNLVDVLFTNHDWKYQIDRASNYIVLSKIIMDADIEYYFQCLKNIPEKDDIFVINNIEDLYE